MNANRKTVKQIESMTPYNAAEVLRCLLGDDTFWTRDDAARVLREGAWGNGEALAANERAALTVIENAENDVNF